MIRLNDMGALLEVIVTNVEEAREAEAGGADRLELLAAPEHAGLTPPLALVESVVGAVSIPVRAMLRPRPAMSIRNERELQRIVADAHALSRFPLDGLVAGFLAGAAIDEVAMRRIISATGERRITFHRAFDRMPDQSGQIESLKHLPCIDRLLTSCGSGDWAERMRILAALQQHGAPQIKIIFAVGRDTSRLGDLRRLPFSPEVHVGRAAREPNTISGRVSRTRIAALKRVLEFSS